MNDVLNSDALKMAWLQGRTDRTTTFVLPFPEEPDLAEIHVEYVNGNRNCIFYTVKEVESDDAITYNERTMRAGKRYSELIECVTWRNLLRVYDCAVKNEE